MKDTWFRLYSYGEAVHNEKTGERVLPPTWGPAENEPLHVYGTDSYHPDPRVRVAFARSVGQGGTMKTACGKEIDPRMVYVEEHDESERCAGCIAAISAAEPVHQEAQTALYQKQAAALEAKLRALGIEIPEAVAPEAVDEAKLRALGIEIPEAVAPETAE